MHRACQGGCHFQLFDLIEQFNQFGSVNFAQTSFTSNLRGDALQKATAQLIVGIITKLTKDYRYHFCIAVEDVQWMVGTFLEKLSLNNIALT